MGIGASVFLIALGAILAFAVEVSVQGVDLDAVGYILMIVGIIGLIASMVFWGGGLPYGRRRDEVVVRDRYVDRDVI